MKVYFPFKHEDVPASPPHPPNTMYRVSKGREHWGDDMSVIVKVQMVYDGSVSGRKAPSYPEDTDDLERVMEALARIRKGNGKTS